ncbi:acyl-CoA dehydrogenase NM domain-like protein [Atractiella rhizophila]|nr:acyl-CoA dehydrogenase NM domain-like protein [Atractiella rhizophila]
MAAEKQLRQLSREEVKKHNTPESLWIIIDTYVYDITKFADMHPGGAAVLYDKEVMGQDSTDVFFGLHRAEVLKKYQRLIVGRIAGEKTKIIIRAPGTQSQVPYAEPMWLTKGYYSPYYNDSHRRLQQYMRKFVDEHVVEHAQEIEQSNERPDPELIKEMGRRYINHMRLGPGKHLHGLTLPGDVKGEEFDYFHDHCNRLIVTQELSRIAARGAADGLQGGMVIGLPPVLNFGSPAVKKEVIEPVLKGEKFISLAISEAFAGSDVAQLRCTATKTEDGKFWIINGTKKWITNGQFSDYFTTGCNTGKGLTAILVPRIEGVETKQMTTSYSKAAGTAYITYDNVKVPVEYTLGQENKGIYVILSNFNHERWVMCCGVTRGTRAIVEECFKWAHQRKVFGKPLISQPVIRQKFSHMFAKVEAGQSWLETVTYQMTHMNYAQQSDLVAGQIALLKQYLTRIAHEVADEAVQIFGGRGITKTGMGKHVEMFQRSYKFDSILGGAEEVLGDLGVRQAMKKMPPAVL